MASNIMTSEQLISFLSLTNLPQTNQPEASFFNSTLNEEQEVHEDSFEAAFVEEVRSYRCLWDTTARGFKDTPMKKKAWQEIAFK